MTAWVKNPAAKERVRARRREWGERNRDRLAAYMRDYRASHPGSDHRVGRTHSLADDLCRQYQITELEFWAMYYAQGGRCAICGNPETATFRGKVKRLAVDHNQVDGAVHGLLCSKCNLAIGLLRHDGVTTYQAAAYVGH